MDLLYTLVGAPTTNDFTTSTSGQYDSIKGDGGQTKPASISKRRFFFSRSVGEINSTSTNQNEDSTGHPGASNRITQDSPSPFRRALSTSFHHSFRIHNRVNLRKNHSLKEKNSICTGSTKLTDDPVTKTSFVSPTGGIFWRASKRFFFPSTTSVKEIKMPASKVSRDDNQMRTSRQHSRHRQRTASPPIDQQDSYNQKTRSHDSVHLSPFRSLPNAKRTLRALMKWPSVVPASSSSSSIATENTSPSSSIQTKRKPDNNANWQKCQISQANSPTRTIRQHQQNRKLDVGGRVHECVKDLNVSLRFLDDVVKKDKLLMLDGSASVVLDTVLKLLLILNEKRRRHCSEGNENQDILQAYNSVYKQLAALLKFTDELTVKDVTATSIERQQAAELCQALKDSVQALLALSSDDRSSQQCPKRNVTSRGVTAKEPAVRKSSSSTSSSSAPDWAAEDEGLDRLEHLDNSLCGLADANHQNRQSTGSSLSASRPLSSISTSSSSGCGIVTTPLNAILMKGRPGHSSLASATSPGDGGLSPPRSDSGIFSLNETGGGSTSMICNTENSSICPGQQMTGTTTVTVSSPDGGDSLVHSGSMSFLDEILEKLKLNGTVEAIDQENIANGDVETVTEEVEEMVGDTKIKRTKIITRQKIRHKSVVTTTVTTQHPVNESHESVILQLLAAPSTAEDGKIGPVSNQLNGITSVQNGPEIRIVENECYKLAGGKNLLESNSSVSCETLPPALSILPCGSAKSIASCDGGKEIVTGQNMRRGSETKVVSMSKQKQESLMQQSASLQSFYRQILMNGQLVKTESGEKFDLAAIKASKSETFDGNGQLLQQCGSGSYAELGYMKGDCNRMPQSTCSIHSEQEMCGCGNRKAVVPKSRHDMKGIPPQPPPRPPKPSVVSSYVQLFGTGTPSNQADFRSSTLATYVHLRDRWNDHFEAHKRKAMTFQFVSTPNSSSPTSAGGASGHATNSPGTTRTTENSCSNSSPKIAPNLSYRSRREIEEDGEEGVPIWLPRKPHDEYQNLVNILNVNEYLKFPKQAAVEAPAERKQIPFRATLALTDMNLLDEIDVRQHLMCKKSPTDEGPDIRGGTVDALIVHATKTASDAGATCGHHSSNQVHGFCYQEAFLTTYRTFIPPLELIKKLMYRYNKFNSCTDDSVKKKAAKNTFSLLVRVVDDLSAVEVTEDVMRLLSDLIYDMITSGELNFSRLLRQKLMERYKMKRQRALEDSHPLYPPISADSPGASGKTPSWLDFKASFLAEQFTFLDWYYFQKIELSEMLLWAQEQSEEHSPNLTNFTEHFNKMSYWVRTRILEQSDQKERERVFAKFVKIMRHLRRLNNFNSCLALLSALDSGPIRRLDWPKASVEALNEHSSLIDSSQSFKTYRMALAEAKPPCLPYIGLILQDLTFVHIGNPNHLPSDQCQGRRSVLNFAKRWQQYTILDNMRRFKAWPYGIKKNELILAALNDFNGYISEDAMWDISEKIKPRQQHHHVTGVARRIIVNPS